jgi:hypothetical protein
MYKDSLSRKFMGRCHLVYVSVEGRIILIKIMEKYCVNMKTEYARSRVGSNGRLS